MRTESLTIHPDLVDMDQEVSHMLAPTCANQYPSLLCALPLGGAEA